MRFADDMDGLAASETELRELVSRIERTSEEYETEINNNGMSTDVQIAGNTYD